VIDVRVSISAIESNLATKKCIADALFLSGSWAFCFAAYSYATWPDVQVALSFSLFPLSLNLLSPALRLFRYIFASSSLFSLFAPYCYGIVIMFIDFILILKLLELELERTPSSDVSAS